MSFKLNTISVVEESEVMSLNVMAPAKTGREIILLFADMSASAIIAALVSSTLSLNSGDLSSFRLSLYLNILSVVPLTLIGPMLSVFTK
jgi:hypothetical protein